MEEYPPNSRSLRQAQEPPEPPANKKVERVVQGDVVRRKRPLGRRLAQHFFGTDARGAWSHVALEILLPSIKDGFLDSFHELIDNTFGNGRGYSRHRRRRPGDGSYISYNNYSKSDRREESRHISRRSRANHNFDEIILPSRVEAEEVLDRLYDLVGKFDVATVADLYDLVGVSGNYTDQKWGWEDLGGSKAVRVRGGYLLELPRPEPLD